MVPVKDARCVVACMSASMRDGARCAVERAFVARSSSSGRARSCAARAGDARAMTRITRRHQSRARAVESHILESRPVKVRPQKARATARPFESPTTFRTTAPLPLGESTLVEFKRPNDSHVSSRAIDSRSTVDRSIDRLDSIDRSMCFRPRVARAARHSASDGGAHASDATTRRLGVDERVDERWRW